LFKKRLDLSCESEDNEEADDEDGEELANEATLALVVWCRWFMSAMFWSSLFKWFVLELIDSASDDKSAEFWWPIVAATTAAAIEAMSLCCCWDDALNLGNLRCSRLSKRFDFILDIALAWLLRSESI